MTLCSSVFHWSHLHFFILVLLFSFNHFFLNGITPLRICAPNYSSVFGFIIGVTPPSLPPVLIGSGDKLHRHFLGNSFCPSLWWAHFLDHLLKVRMQCRVRLTALLFIVSLSANGVNHHLSDFGNH